MVQLTLTPVARDAIAEYGRDAPHDAGTENASHGDVWGRVSGIEVGGPIDHDDLIQISKHLSKQSNQTIDLQVAGKWRLESLLKGAKPYQPALPPKPEPTPEYKALMKRLREDEERKQYERMVNPPVELQASGHNSATGKYSFNPALLIGQSATADDVDEVTYADVNRQLALIINILVSIIACSVAIWIAARRWNVPQRLGLSLSGSAIIAIAEVAIYMGYIRRIKDAKSQEAKVIEEKEVVESWVIDRKPKTSNDDSVRYRKGKHR